MHHTPKHIRLNERNHVHKPLLDQLAGLGCEAIDRAKALEQYVQGATE